MDGTNDNHCFEGNIPTDTTKEEVVQILRLLSEKTKKYKIIVHFETNKFFFKFSKRSSDEDLVSICPEEDCERTCLNGRRRKIDFDSLKTKDFDALFTDLAKGIKAVRSYRRNKVKCHKKGDKSVQSKTRKDVTVRLSPNIVPSSCTQVTVAIKSDIESEEKERQEPEIEKFSSEKTFEILKSNKVDESDVNVIYEVSSTLDQVDIPSQNIPTQTHAIESRKKFSVTLKNNNNKQRQERNRQWSKLHTKYRMKRREAYWKRKKLRIRKVCKFGIKKQWKKRKKRQSGRFKRKLKAESPEKKTKWKKKAAKAKSWLWILNDYLKQKSITVDNTLLDRYDKNCKETSWLLRDLTALLHHERSWRVSGYVYPTRRKNKGNRRNQQGRASSSQAAESAQNRPPIQVSDASNRDLDLPPGQLVVTSSRSTFNAFANNLSSPTPSSTVSIDSERTLRTRLRRELPDSRFSRAQQRPKHPEYSDQPARQRSFTNWPATTGQDPARMAIYGFFYTGRLDLIRCFQCGIGLKDWAGADEPLFEHIKHSPDCSFLKDLLGQDLFIAYRDNLQASQSQQASSTATSAGSETTAARVRNPQFKEMPARLNSFDKWPTTAQQSPQRLADAGLFYTGMNDLCRCFTCDGGLQRWDADDDPWIEHARWFPQCQYVRQIKGQEYINMVQQAAAQARAEEEDPSVIIPAVAQGAGRTGPVQQGMEDLNLEDNSPLNTYAAHSVIGIGFSRRAVLIAIDEYKRQAAPGKENDYGSTDLVRILRDREARGEALPPDSPMDTYLGATAAVLLPENLDPEEENRRLRDIMKCMVCRENDTNILFLPCTHHRMCEECAEKVQVCPVCDQKISEKIKTYLS